LDVLMQRNIRLGLHADPLSYKVMHKYEIYIKHALKTVLFKIS